ncbi:MAG: hypothetical protein ACD_41C00179G0001 [uncultured bacterium]|nr:MAG: hypothetical protein ACD_41C00179G0001 [uncultured bacterium]HBY73273.1 hypothetical protein [Candidatus Kerfeldbacteria bacterium]
MRKFREPRDIIEEPQPDGIVDVADLQLEEINWQSAEWDHDLMKKREPYSYETVETRLGEMQFLFNGKLYTLQAKKADYTFNNSFLGKQRKLGNAMFSVLHDNMEVLQLKLNHDMGSVESHIRTVNYTKDHQGLGMAVYGRLVPQYTQDLANCNKANVTHRLTHGARIGDTLPFEKWMKVMDPFIDQHGYRSEYGTFPKSFIKVYQPEPVK